MKNIKLSTLLLIGFGGFVAINFLTSLSKPRPPKPATQASKPAATATCKPASGNFYTNVKLHLNGSCSEPFAVVLGGNDRYKGFGSPTRAVKIKYLNNGNVEWKDRQALGDRAYIKSDDPALAAGEWIVYKR